MLRDEKTVLPVADGFRQAGEELERRVKMCSRRDSPFAESNGLDIVCDDCGRGRRGVGRPTDYRTDSISAPGSRYWNDVSEVTVVIAA